MQELASKLNTFYSQFMQRPNGSYSRANLQYQLGQLLKDFPELKRYKTKEQNTKTTNKRYIIHTYEDIETNTQYKTLLVLDQTLTPGTALSRPIPLDSIMSFKVIVKEVLNNY